MPPKRVQKRKSTASNTSTAMSQFPHPPAAKASTPRAGKSPARQRSGLSLQAKQAMLENLQLEITERARKLRAQYALQAQGLRTRLELRIHRIPMALRKTTIQELLERYAQTGTTSPRKALPSTATHTVANAPPAKGVKRTSTQIEDKENTDADHPPKRIRSDTTAPTAQPARAPSRRAAPSQVLSPKSGNSRTLPRSPGKVDLYASPQKPSTAARPASPLKPSLVAQTASSLAKTADKAKTGRAPARTASRAAPSRAGVRKGAGKAVEEEEDKRDSTTSNTTSTSSGTTIVKRGRQAARAAPSATVGKSATAKPKKTGLAGKFAGITATGKRLVGGDKGDSAKSATVKGGRTLRKRD